MKILKKVLFIFICYFSLTGVSYCITYDKVIINMKNKTLDVASSTKQIYKVFKNISDKIKTHILNITKIQQEIEQAKKEGTLTSEKYSEYLQKIKKEAYSIKRILENNQETLLNSIDTFYRDTFKAINFSMVADGSSSQIISRLRLQLKNFNNEFSKEKKEYRRIREEALRICKEKGEKDPDCLRWYKKYKYFKRTLKNLKRKIEFIKKNIELNKKLQYLVKTIRSDLFYKMEELSNNVYSRIISLYENIEQINTGINLGEIQNTIIQLSNLIKNFDESSKNFQIITEKTINFVQEFDKIPVGSFSNTEVASAPSIIEELEKEDKDFE